MVITVILQNKAAKSEKEYDGYRSLCQFIRERVEIICISCEAARVYKNYESA